ncbi:MAG: hypothetical protein ABGW82_03055, partial [Paracoccus sp. (in: a-proteobacteria)]
PGAAHRLLAGKRRDRAALTAQAARLADSGGIPTVLCLSATARPHRMAFDPAGYWLQTGGRFGRSLRRGPRVRACGFRARVAEEAARLFPLRPFESVKGPDGVELRNCVPRRG